MAKEMTSASAQAIVKAIAGYGSTNNVHYTFRKLGLSLDGATAYETDPESYGKAYKSKKNGKDLVAYFQGDVLQAIIFGKNYVDGVVADRVHSYGDGNRSYALYAKNSDRLIVVPQDQVVELQEAMNKLRADRRAAKAVATRQSLTQRLAAFKKEKMNAVDGDALKAQGKAALVDLTDYVDRDHEEGVREALCEARVHNVPSLMSSLADAIRDCGRVTREYEAALAKYSDDEFGKYEIGYALKNRNDKLLDLKETLVKYQAFKAALEGARATAVAA